ncbi:alanine racemase, partial [Patescibacteria group bacterium]|nr:alanine racemase [Patescibacteria group bacterium]
MQKRKNLRTWIEVDSRALEHNLKQFLKLIPRRTRFMAVVKSNAYGHGLVDTAKALLALRSFSEGGWLGVDSITEAFRLRKEGIKNPILVLGFTLGSMMQDAARNNIIVSVSNFDSLADLARAKEKPIFHLKFDTGMHRQGFLPEQTPQLMKLMKRHGLSPQGMFTHFAAAKDIAYPTYTLEQFRKFNMIAKLFEQAGFKNIIRHTAASGGTLLFPETDLDMVRVGMGIYGYWPSPESRIMNHEPEIILRPPLQWKTIVAETKEIPKGSYIGYDLTERVSRKTNIAVLPVG